LGTKRRVTTNLSSSRSLTRRSGESKTLDVPFLSEFTTI
jgi:hypothetical protein